MKLKNILLTVLAVCFMLTFVSCQQEKQTGTYTTVSLSEGVEEHVDKPDEGNTVDPAKFTTVTGTFTFAKLGQVKFEIYPQYAPQSALNFLYLAQNGCYNGTIVDRVQKGYTIEMGEYYEGFAKVLVPDGEEYTIKGEFANNGVDNPLSVAEGMLVWCRDYEDPDSAKTKFMICLDTAAVQGLQDYYAPFGKITEGMDIIKKIGSRKVDENNRPKNTVMLLSVEIDGDTIYPAPDKIKR